MVSHDTIVHLQAVLLAFAVLLLASLLGVGIGSGPAGVALFVVYNGLIFGGAHLYLAAKGEDGMVPADARWRYVGVLGVLLGVGAIAQYAGGASFGPVALDVVLLAVLVCTGIVYLSVETIDAYRDARPE